MTDTSVATIKAHCPECGPQRNAYVRAMHVVDRHDDDDGTSARDTSSILQCCGCDRVFFRHDVWFSEWETIGHHPLTGELRIEGGIETTYWPPLAARKTPKWVEDLSLVDRTLGSLLVEMYAALNANLRVLAAIGIRTAFDHSSGLLGIDVGLPFERKLAELASSGKIGSDEQEKLAVLVDAGSAAAHRAWSPAVAELAAMADLVESFLYRSFVLGDGIDRLKAAVPKKQKWAAKLEANVPGNRDGA